MKLIKEAEAAHKAKEEEIKEKLNEMRAALKLV